MKTFFGGLVLFWLFYIFVVLTLGFNVGGYGQRIWWGMEPPYHWVIDNHSEIGYIEAYYRDVNGKDCATLYAGAGVLEGNSTEWFVYGYGFSKDKVSKERAVQIATDNCK